MQTSCQTNRQTDGRTDRQKDRWIDKQTDSRTDSFKLVPTEYTTCGPLKTIDKGETLFWLRGWSRNYLGNKYPCGKLANSCGNTNRILQFKKKYYLLDRSISCSSLFHRISRLVTWWFQQPPIAQTRWTQHSADREGWIERLRSEYLPLATVKIF